MKFLIIILLLGFTLQLSGQNRSEENIEKAGDILEIVIPATGLTIELIRGDKKGVLQFVKAFSANFIVVHALKRIIEKERPNGGNHAFPSGHTSAAFQGAAFIHRRYGFKYSIPLYLGAAYVGYSRTHGINKHHDFWDVSAGAILGVASSFIFAKKLDETKVRVYSYPFYNGLALKVQIKF